MPTDLILRLYPLCYRCALSKSHGNTLINTATVISRPILTSRNKKRSDPSRIKPFILNCTEVRISYFDCSAMVNLGSELQLQ